MNKKQIGWAAPGDVNAFFGLMLDNIADLVLAVGLLSAVFGFPATFSLRYMVPGTAIGVLIGDLIFFWIGLRLAAKLDQSDYSELMIMDICNHLFKVAFYL